MSRLSKVVVVGVHHYLQNLEVRCETPDGRESEARQKAALKARLEDLISRHQPQLIGEEEKPGAACIGKELADAHGLKYCPLSMPRGERHKAGISEDYSNTPETRRAAYEMFESFMFEQIQKNRGDAASILVICGSYHMERLAKRFFVARDEVWAMDTYYELWFEGWPIESQGRVFQYDKERHDV
jgi:hypothetical protein